VVDAEGRLAGLLSGNVVKDRYKTKKVSEVMTPRAQLMTEKESAVAKDPIKAADAFFTHHVGINKMLVVDDAAISAGSSPPRMSSASPRNRGPATSRPATLIFGSSSGPRSRRCENRTAGSTATNPRTRRKSGG